MSSSVVCPITIQEQKAGEKANTVETDAA